MAQSLLIGLGGTGSRVVNDVVKMLHNNGKTFNNGDICCAVLDTNVNDNELIINSGTGIPVIPTSKPQKIRDYFDEYHHLHMETWCPQSPAFLESSMIDGASEHRVKSRIAFMDCLESGVIDRLELMINNILKNNDNSKIRIMIVSSLSGGTGSGMFIQVALWLRKFFAETKSEITIRGIFLLPDIFVNNLENVRGNKSTKTRHYCNAYAAIRELNAITKIMKSGSADLPEKIQVGKLFDSTKDANCGVPVYDFAFFIDDKDQNGVRLANIIEYEEMVAQLVYMQLYAPMRNNIYSEEDNAFLHLTLHSREPLYGSCGTSKAVYPRGSVKSYCAIRASQDSLTDSWQKIDNEIEDKKEERRQLKKDGVVSSEKIDERELFMKLYEDKTSVSEEEAGEDKFFLSIAKDSVNIIIDKDGDKPVPKEIDKVKDFMNLLDQEIKKVALKNSGTGVYAIDADEFVEEKHEKDELYDQIESDREGLEQAITNFEKNVKEYSNSVVDKVFPYSMGDVNSKNECSIYGLLTKPDDSFEKRNFIHPVAARYVLNKLAKNLEDACKDKKIMLKAAKEQALSGGKTDKLFDNKATKHVVETTAEELLDSQLKRQRNEAFLDDFEERYAEFITTKIKLCEYFEIECLRDSVYQGLLNRVKELIKQVESFFKNLPDVQEKLKNELEDNIKETDDIIGKTLFVFGSEQDKEYTYQSLDLNVGNTSEIYGSVIGSIYGKLCAEKRKNDKNNLAYRDIGVIDSFILDVFNDFVERINNDQNNSALVNLDIYEALCKECNATAKETADRKHKRAVDEGTTVRNLGVLNNVNLATGTITNTNNATQTYRIAFNGLKDKLMRLAAPFLSNAREVTDDKLGIINTMERTFWGFSPVVANKYNFISTDLHTNADISANDAYSKSELYCYRAIYGLEAKYIPKFNELSNGNYYACYSHIVNDMIEAVEGKASERALVLTPHLDKNWHRILPYITAEKQEQEELAFYRGLWLAIAYGMIKTDKGGNVLIRRRIPGGYGNYVDNDFPIMYNGKKVKKTDVARLIDVLRKDKVFTDKDIPELEAKLEADLDGMNTYVGTEVLKGLMVEKEDLNPINFVVRYNEAPNHDIRVSAHMIGALEKIASDLAEKYNLDRDSEHLEVAKYTICRKIYDSSSRVKGRSEIFGTWEKKFEEYGIKEEASGSSK